MSISQLADLKISQWLAESFELLAVSFGLTISEDRLVARSLQLAALDSEQSYNSSRSK